MLYKLLQCVSNKRNLLKSVLIGGTLSIASTLSASAWAVEAPPSAPPSLSKLRVPEPSNLSTVVADRAEAIALGKALFWDMRVGSDGRQACASCHFSAGADPRIKNQLSPGPNATTFAYAGPNYTLTASDFPFVKFANNNKHFSTLETDRRVVASSQGVFNTSFGGIRAGGFYEDIQTVVNDPVFNIYDINTRKVAPRNSPTVINAVFNFRNFWDGRAQNIFNGVNIWGKRDANARVFKSPLALNPLNLANKPQPFDLVMFESSLASQAVGPVLSDFEMSAHGRNFPEVGRKLLTPFTFPLQIQKVAADDSVLAPYRNTVIGWGLNKSYSDMIKKAFKPEWWNGNQPVTVDGKSYSHMEANFSLYFGLALQMYQSTLISGNSPYDEFANGNYAKLSPRQQVGFGVFMGKGKCVSCHAGANFSTASFEHKLNATERMNRMIMGSHKRAVYDEGFYNIGVTRTADDIALGGKDPWGKPLSFSGLSKLDSGLTLLKVEREAGNVIVSPNERIAVQGSFKTPTLRNVALTAPYFHDGSAANLMQVVELYNRGGNFPHENIENLDADIEPLHLTQPEKEALVDFLHSLTDPRVAKHAAPFDHPELFVLNGHDGDENSAMNDGKGRATEDAGVIRLAAVGKTGYTTPQLQTFNEALGLGQYVPTSNSQPDSPQHSLLSVGKPALQSSTDYGGSAKLAVDGNTNGIWMINSVTHTAFEAQSWWQVDLGGINKITKVEIYNRTDCCSDRLRNFVIAISPNNMAGLTLAQLKADPSVKLEHVESIDESGSYHFDEVNGRYVRVQLEGSNILSLAEVEVYGIPAASDGNVVTAYTDADYSGPAWSIGVGTYDIDTIKSWPVGNDAISSIKIAPGYSVVACEDAYFAGACMTYNDSINWLAGFNDRISSIKVIKK